MKSDRLVTQQDQTHMLNNEGLDIHRQVHKLGGRHGGIAQSRTAGVVGSKRNWINAALSQW